MPRRQPVSAANSATAASLTAAADLESEDTSGGEASAGTAAGWAISGTPPHVMTAAAAASAMSLPYGPASPACGDFRPVSEEALVAAACSPADGYASVCCSSPQPSRDANTSIATLPCAALEADLGAVSCAGLCLRGSGAQAAGHRSHAHAQCGASTPALHHDAPASRPSSRPVHSSSRSSSCFEAAAVCHCFLANRTWSSIIPQFSSSHCIMQPAAGAAADGVPRAAKHGQHVLGSQHRQHAAAARAAGNIRQLRGVSKPGAAGRTAGRQQRRLEWGLH